MNLLGKHLKGEFKNLDGEKVEVDEVITKFEPSESSNCFVINGKILVPYSVFIKSEK